MFSGFKQQDSDELLRNILWHLDNEQSDVSPSGVISRLFRGKLQTEVSLILNLLLEVVKHYAWLDCMCHVQHEFSI